MWWLFLRPFAREALRPVPPGGRILDVGTGPGLMPTWWAVKRPDIEVVGLDMSAPMLELARRRARRHGVSGRVRFLRADATDTGLPSGSFDVVVCHYMLHHIAEPAGVLREMARLTGPGGVVLACDLVRPRPWLARLSVLFTTLFLRNSRQQNRQYAESLAAALTADEMCSMIDRERLAGFRVRSGPVHITVSRVPAPAPLAHAPLTHERVGRILAGVSVLAGLGLCLLSPWFLLLAAGTGLNLVFSGIADRCAVKRLLIRLGVPGERDVGRTEAVRESLSARGIQEPVDFARAHSGRPVNRIGAGVN
jgi:ubiquinone/menaquinone biosynthesis C-methylase UbiE